MKIGTLVVLIGTDGYMPPLGACGEIVSREDVDGDYDVLFPHHPCPNPPDTSWIAHRSWLLPVGQRDKALQALMEAKA